MVRIYHPYRNILLYVTTKHLYKWIKLGFRRIDSNVLFNGYSEVLH